MSITVCNVYLLLFITIFSCLPGPTPAITVSPVAGKRICIDAGHGGTAATDFYRVGKNGEREEWINLRVAKHLQQLLEKSGAIVTMTRNTDTVVDLSLRAAVAVNMKADAFISIHHNATADSSVNFPIIYYHGAASENLASVALSKQLATAFRNRFFKSETPVSVVSDYTIFPEKGAGVLRDSYGIPGVLAEASFFTNGEEENRLKTNEHNAREAEAYFTALETFFRSEAPPIYKKQIPTRLPVFAVLQESERMKPEALMWRKDFEQGNVLMKRTDSLSLATAYELFTRSARSFPDSYVAKQCHENRAAILHRQGKKSDAANEKVRSREYYVATDRK